MLGYGSDKTSVKLILVFFVFLVFTGFSVSAAKQRIIVGKDISIPANYIKLLIKGMPEDARKLLLNDDLKLDKYLNFIAQVEAFYLEAKKMGLDKDPVLRAQAEFCKKKLLAEAALKKKVYEKLKSFKLTEEDLKLYYETHKSDFMENNKPLPFNKVKWIIRDILIKKKKSEVTDQIIKEVLKRRQVKIQLTDKKQLLNFK